LNLANATFTNNIQIGTKTITDANITEWDDNVFNVAGGVIYPVDEYYDADMQVNSTFTSLNIDTGEGTTEVFAMNQDIQTSDNVEFEDVTVDDELKMANGGTSWNMYVNATGVLVWEMV